MAVLLTGGAGFIGSHTCVEFVMAGETVIVLDDYSNAKPEVMDKIKEITGKSIKGFRVNLSDEAPLREVFKRNEIESVVHFAGRKAVGESVDMPLLYYTTNVSGTLNLLRVMEEFSCRKIVFSSSATVYGADNEIPYREDMSLYPSNPYGQTKAMIERIITDLCASDSRWSAVLLRYFNPIGAHNSGLIGEDPEGIPNNLAPYIAQVAAGKLPHLNVYGGDYPTGDGTGVRDYIHVVDLALGHLEALRYTRENMGCEAVNLGSGRGYSVLEVLRSYEKTCGKKLPYIIAPRRPGDLAEFYADTSKAKKLLDWEAKRSLDEMCQDSWRFALNMYKDLIYSQTT